MRGLCNAQRLSSPLCPLLVSSLTFIPSSYVLSSLPPFCLPPPLCPFLIHPLPFNLFLSVPSPLILLCPSPPFKLALFSPPLCPLHIQFCSCPPCWTSSRCKGPDIPKFKFLYNIDVLIVLADPLPKYSFHPICLASLPPSPSHILSAWSLHPFHLVLASFLPGHSCILSIWSLCLSFAQSFLPSSCLPPPTCLVSSIPFPPDPSHLPPIQSLSFNGNGIQSLYIKIQPHQSDG